MNKIPVFFNRRMVANSEAFSPSAAKPLPVVEAWLKSGLAEVRDFKPATNAQMIAAHNHHFVMGVLSGRISNGFGNRSKAVIDSLPYTTGAMVAATRYAAAFGGVAAAPCSGFHHAGYDSAGGFCTFNGLMIAAMDVLQSGAKKVGILDLDMHYGDGTDDIIRALHVQDRVVHFTGGRDFHHPNQAGAFLDNLSKLMLQFKGCDVLLYQAGADPHIDDPLGGWLTTDELAQRDNIVFHTAKQMNLPVAWNLAGGYQKEADGSIPKVIEIHNNTMRECAEVYL